MELPQDSFVIGCSVFGCETSMLEELALGGERTVTLGTLFGVFLAAWRTGKKETHFFFLSNKCISCIYAKKLKPTTTFHCQKQAQMNKNRNFQVLKM